MTESQIDRLSSRITSQMFMNNLFIMLFGLKLTGHINCSWWWVFAPMWGTAVLFIICQALKKT